MMYLLCRFLPHKWQAIETKRKDFGMRALKVMQEVRCRRCGEEKRRAGFTSPVGIIWKGEGGGMIEWESIDQRDWEEL